MYLRKVSYFTRVLGPKPADSQNTYFYSTLASFGGPKTHNLMCFIVFFVVSVFREFIDFHVFLASNFRPISGLIYGWIKKLF